MLNVQRHRVDQAHRVSLCSQPASIGAGTAADIEDIRRGRRQVALEQFLRAHELQRQLVLGEPSLLLAFAVVRQHLRR